MVRRPCIHPLLCITVLGFTSTALAQEMSTQPADTAGAMPAPVVSPAPAPGLDTGAAPAADEAAAVATTTATAATTTNFAQYGLAARLRWISVPGWFLKLFTEKNVPLSTYGVALEGFRRKHDKDDHNRTWELAVAIGYQNMSPPDGYWLGKGKDVTGPDTDLVQFRNFSLITMDAAFISRQYFNPYFGIHYGAGLGLAVVRGKVLRTSATYNSATGQYEVRAPTSPNGTPGTLICDGNAKCNETLLNQYQTGPANPPDGGPTNAHRFEENSIPGAIPIINVLFGLDFPVPDAKGLEFRVEGGFYDAFFLGGSAGYVF